MGLNIVKLPFDCGIFYNWWKLCYNFVNTAAPKVLKAYTGWYKKELRLIVYKRRVKHDIKFLSFIYRYKFINYLLRPVNIKF